MTVGDMVHVLIRCKNEADLQHALSSPIYTLLLLEYPELVEVVEYASMNVRSGGASFPGRLFYPHPIGLSWSDAVRRYEDDMEGYKKMLREYGFE